MTEGDGGGRTGAKGSGVVAEGKVVSVKKGRLYMIHIRKSVFFYAVLDQVLLSPGNIAMYWQIFKQLPNLCTLAKFLAPPTEMKERRFRNSLNFPVTVQKPVGKIVTPHSFSWETFISCNRLLCFNISFVSYIQCLVLKLSTGGCIERGTAANV